MVHFSLVWSLSLDHQLAVMATKRIRPSAYVPINRQPSVVSFAGFTVVGKPDTHPKAPPQPAFIQEHTASIDRSHRPKRPRLTQLQLGPSGKMVQSSSRRKPEPVGRPPVPVYQPTLGDWKQIRALEQDIVDAVGPTDPGGVAAALRLPLEEDEALSGDVSPAELTLRPPRDHPPYQAAISRLTDRLARLSTLAIGVVTGTHDRVTDLGADGHRAPLYYQSTHGLETIMTHPDKRSWLVTVGWDLVLKVCQPTLRRPRATSSSANRKHKKGQQPYTLTPLAKIYISMDQKHEFEDLSSFAQAPLASEVGLHRLEQGFWYAHGIQRAKNNYVLSLEEDVPVHLLRVAEEQWSNTEDIITCLQAVASQSATGSDWTRRGQNGHVWSTVPSRSAKGNHVIVSSKRMYAAQGRLARSIEERAKRLLVDRQRG